MVYSMISNLICSDGVWLNGLLKFISSVNSVLVMLFVLGCLKLKCSGYVMKYVIDISCMVSSCFM